MANTPAYQGYRHAPTGDKDFAGVYNIALSGSYVQTTGESVNLLAATNANGLELNGAVPAGTGAQVIVESANVAGYTPIISAYSNGTFTMTLFSGGTELAAGAYPASSSVTVSVPHRL